MKLEEFREFARAHNVIPVSRRVLADGETPLAIYRKLAKNNPGTFLLESAEHGGAWSRYSFIGVRSETTLTETNGVAHWLGRPPAGVPRDLNPLDALKKTIAHLKTPTIAGLPPLTGGLVGYLGYDAVRRLESLPQIATDDLRIPEISFMLTSDLAVLDHSDGTVTLIANAINWDGSDERVDEAYSAALKRLDSMYEDLQSSLPGDVSDIPTQEPIIFDSNLSPEDFRTKVEIAKEEIRAGEAFQIVLSQRFVTEVSADSLTIYRTLRLSNPSPYMYLFRFEGGFDVVGSSPEALVKVSGREVLVHPIAGTRKRAESLEEDLRIGEELLADPKERAEHLMLVDLGRNDVGRVCTPGSVEVIDFMHLERYSHVMHIVSTVIGELSESAAPIDALFSVFPAGTLSGAPKPRAMEIIERLEPTRRGLYGGAIGYFDFKGNIDTCIAIRTALVKDGKAFVQAGAGVVADSVPEAEYQETRNKAAAVLNAIAMANTISQTQLNEMEK